MDVPKEGLRECICPCCGLEREVDGGWAGEIGGLLVLAAEICPAMAATAAARPLVGRLGGFCKGKGNVGRESWVSCVWVDWLEFGCMGGFPGRCNMDPVCGRDKGWVPGRGVVREVVNGDPRAWQVSRAKSPSGFLSLLLLGRLEEGGLDALSVLSGDLGLAVRRFISSMA